MEGRADARAYRRYIDDLGFSIPQGHLLFGERAHISAADNAASIDLLKRNINVFLELGVKAAVLHYGCCGTDVLPIEDYFDNRVAALNELTSYVKGTELSICLENLSRVHDYDATHLVSMCRAVDHQENIGICLDTGHLNISQRGDPYTFIEQAGGYLKAMHVHDNRGEQHGLQGSRCDWHITPFDGGNINWARVKAGVKDAQYEGLFSYELSNSGIPMEIKELQAKYLLEVYRAYFAF
jgi:sugar phosphate isomerase/epimerase